MYFALATLFAGFFILISGYTAQVRKLKKELKKSIQPRDPKTGRFIKR